MERHPLTLRRRRDEPRHEKRTMTITLERARQISNELIPKYSPMILPVAEARELDPDSGWLQWDLAVALDDAYCVPKSTAKWRKDVTLVREKVRMP